MVLRVFGGALALLAVVAIVLVYKVRTGATPRDTVGATAEVMRENARLVYYVLEADGPTIVMVPSLGRSASDFNELALDMHMTHAYDR